MTPNPTVPSSSSSSQPTINTFFSRTSSAVRQSVSAALDMTPAPSQGRVRRSELSSSSDSDGEEMDQSENRKRSRDDSIMGPNILEPQASASMIVNTSMLDTGSARRRRLSSSEAGASLPPDLTSTPEQRIQAQMDTIRDDIILEETPSQVSTDRNTNYQDHSTTSEQFNLNNMVTGIQQLTRGVANIQDPSPGSLTWDDNDINIPSQPMISPRAVPAIDENTPSNNPVLHPTLPDNLPPPVPAIAEPGSTLRDNRSPPPPPTAPSTPDIVDSLKDMVQEQFRAAFENIERKMIESLSDHIRTSDQQYEENKEAIAIVSARADNIEQDIERHQFEIENLNDDAETISGHINRIDEALSIINARAQPRNSPDIQALLARIAVLEETAQRNQLTDQMLDRIKKQTQNEDDRYFMNTLAIKGYNPATVNNNHSVRSAARAILRIIGSEDVISFTSKISFKNDNSRMRLTFDNPNDFRTAIHHLSRSIKQIKDAGHNPGILFQVLTPPRFNKERETLQKIAENMKRDGQISRFWFVLIKNELCIKVSKHGQRDSIIHVPVESEDMDVSVNEQEQAGSRCPICLCSFDNTTEINVYGCGHTFHRPCLRSSLSLSMKCPTCRTIPPQVQLDQIECTHCRSDILDPQSTCNREMIVLSRKCNHLHLYDCQITHIDSLEGNFPQTPEGYANIMAAEGIQGCSSCTRGNVTNFPYNSIIHEVAYQEGMADYIDLENERGTPNPQPPVSGANAIPVQAVVRPLQQPVRPTVSPPPPPSPRARNRQSPRRQ